MSKHMRKPNLEDPQPKEYGQKELADMTKIILETPFWIPELDAEKWYERIHDDHDGELRGNLSVVIDRYGDLRVAVVGVPSGTFLRFRTFIGGGQSERVRKALMILAFAIALDSKDHPQ